MSRTKKLYTLNNKSIFEKLYTPKTKRTRRKKNLQGSGAFTDWLKTIFGNNVGEQPDLASLAAERSDISGLKYEFSNLTPDQQQQTWYDLTEAEEKAGGMNMFTLLGKLLPLLKDIQEGKDIPPALLRAFYQLLLQFLFIVAKATWHLIPFGGKIAIIIGGLILLYFKFPGAFHLLIQTLKYTVKYGVKAIYYSVKVILTLIIKAVKRIRGINTEEEEKLSEAEEEVQNLDEEMMKTILSQPTEFVTLEDENEKRKAQKRLREEVTSEGVFNRNKDLVGVDGRMLRRIKRQKYYYE